MKKKINLIVFSIITLFISCNSISQEEQIKARDFNNLIVEYNSKVTNSVENHIRVISDLFAKSIENTIDSSDIENYKIDKTNLLNDIDIYIDSLKQIPEFDNEIKFRQRSVNRMINQKNQVDKSLTTLVKLVQKEFTNKYSIVIEDRSLYIQQEEEMYKKSLEEFNQMYNK